MEQGARVFRVIDTGVATGRYNIALDQALIDARKAERIPDTIRFLRFEPSVLLGRHQCLSHEIDQAYCDDHAIAIGRRVTGGGALYLDAQQLGWELVFDRRQFALPSLEELTRAVCEAAAFGLATLGPAVRFRPRNDLEVEGRKLGGSGGFFDGPIIFFQGTVLIDTDPQVMFRALAVPGAKRERHGLNDPARRIIGLRELLQGRMPDIAEIKAALLAGFRAKLGIVATAGELSPFERERARDHYNDDVGTDAFVYEIDDPGASADIRSVTAHTAGGTLTVFVKLTTSTPSRIDSVLLTGDFFVTPPRIVFDLEASLRLCPTADIEHRVLTFFAQAQADILSLSPADIARTVAAAAGVVRV